MVETSPVKFYLARYFFLAFSIMLWFLALMYFVRFDYSNTYFFGSFVFFVLGFIFFYLYLLVSDKVKLVAVGKNKIIIMEGRRNIRFEWPEVKSFKTIPLINLCRLRLRGKKDSIFFFPSKKIDSTLGVAVKDFSKAKKKENKIK